MSKPDKQLVVVRHPRLSVGDQPAILAMPGVPPLWCMYSQSKHSRCSCHLSGLRPTDPKGCPRMKSMCSQGALPHAAIVGGHQPHWVPRWPAWAGLRWPSRPMQEMAAVQLRRAVELARLAHSRSASCVPVRQSQVAACKPGAKSRPTAWLLDFATTFFMYAPHAPGQFVETVLERASKAAAMPARQHVDRTAVLPS